MNLTKYKQSGSMLIEALVALVVVSVGTFGVVKLNTVMLSGTGLSKTRAEALQIALKRMEDVRNYPLDGGCPAAADSTETDLVAGVNANYKVGRSISNATAEQVNVDICVAWDGSNAPCTAPQDKRVILKSVMSCMGVGTSGMIGGSAITSNGGNVKTPTGAARVGGGNYGNSKPAGRTVNYVGGGTSGTADGTSTFLTADGKYELIDEATGQVLLTVDDGSAFSTIAGRVLIETGNSGDPIVDPDGASATDISDDNVFVLSSDASYCARSISATLPVLPTGSSGSAVKYRYFDYRCYVSKGWWGNIGIVRLDNPNANNRICVGDTAVSSTETSLWSKKSALSISRGYRSYRELMVNGVGTGTYETIGIGLDTTTGLVYTPTTIPSSANASSEHHDFLVTVINGAGTCQSSGKMDLTSPSQFTDNQGKFYCMSGVCPGLTQTTTTPTTVIHGTITKGTGATLTGIDPADTDCTSRSWTDNGSTYTYSCTLNWTGFAGSAWHGAINFQASGTNTLCAAGATSAVLPSANSVAFTVHDRVASPNPNSLTFTDVPLAVTDVTINFNAAAASCGALGQPAPVWPTGNTNTALSWTAISGATGYKVNTCSISTSTASTCIPSTQTTQTSSSYSPSVGNNNTVCINVIATDSGGALSDSQASPTKCVSRAGGTYTHN